MQLYPAHFQIYFQGISDGFQVVSYGSRWFPLVIPGYPWLSLVRYNSNICEIVCTFAIIKNVSSSTSHKKTSSFRL